MNASSSNLAARVRDGLRQTETRQAREVMEARRVKYQCALEALSAARELAFAVRGTDPVMAEKLLRKIEAAKLSIEPGASGHPILDWSPVADASKGAMDVLTELRNSSHHVLLSRIASNGLPSTLEAKIYRMRVSAPTLDKLLGDAPGYEGLRADAPARTHSAPELRFGP